MATWWFALLACGAGDPAATTPAGEGTEDSSKADLWGSATPTGLATSLLMTAGCSTGTPIGDGADVEAVEASGGPDAWTVSVTVRSPDTGCDQYADWWELVTPEGELVARRILNHSHVDEQPFTRASEAPIELDPSAEVVVRAHLHADGADPTEGYGGQALRGTIDGGFAAADPGDDFATELATVDLLPEDCWF